MNRLLAGTATLALLLAAAPAGAQSYNNANNAKNHDSTLGSAHYIQPEQHTETAPVQTAPAPAPMPEQHAAVETPPPAVEPAAGMDNFSGPYIGTEIGYDFAGGMSGWAGGGFAGYGWTPDVSWASKPYLGVEASYDWRNVDGNAQAEHNKANFTLRPGAVIGENVLGYGILGYSRGNFKSNINNDNDWIGGWTAGLGTEFATSHMPLRVRLEYAYTKFRSGDLGGINIRPHDNDVKLGLVYRFK